jgi:hypothetical protein
MVRVQPLRCEGNCAPKPLHAVRKSDMSCLLVGAGSRGLDSLLDVEIGREGALQDEVVDILINA